MMSPAKGVEYLGTDLDTSLRWDGIQEWSCMGSLGKQGLRQYVRRPPSR